MGWGGGWRTRKGDGSRKLILFTHSRQGVGVLQVDTLKISKMMFHKTNF